MSILLKIYHGTVQCETHLCITCENARNRLVDHKPQYHCQMLPDPKGMVTQCELYRDRAAGHTIRELDARAWHLDMDDEEGLIVTSPAQRNAPRVVRRRRRNPGRVDAEFVPPVPPVPTTGNGGGSVN